jgi:hypothetical protein
MRERKKSAIISSEYRSTIAPSSDHPRAGWSVIARALAKAGDDRLVWPEFGNEDDVKLAWK